MSIKGWFVPSVSSSCAHGDLDKVIILKCGIASLSCVSPSELVGQRSESYTTAHEIIKGDSAVCAVAPHDAFHGLRTQIITHGVEGNLQLRALHRPTAVPIIGCEGVPPAAQNLPQFLELIKTHGAGHVPIQHVDHQSAGVQAEGFV